MKSSQENTQQNRNETETTQKKQTKKQLFGEIIRFLIVGGTATIFDYVVSNLFYTRFLPPELLGEIWSLLISTALGFCVGLIINWLLSITFVFKHVSDKKASRSKKSFVIFAVIGIIGLGITELGMHLGMKFLPDMYVYGTPKLFGAVWKWWFCKVVMTCIVLIWNYCGRKLMIFK